jgi:hypothetical protein
MFTLINKSLGAAILCVCVVACQACYAAAPYCSVAGFWHGNINRSIPTKISFEINRLDGTVSGGIATVAASGKVELAGQVFPESARISLHSRETLHRSDAAFLTGWILGKRKAYGRIVEMKGTQRVSYGWTASLFKAERECP